MAPSEYDRDGRDTKDTEPPEPESLLPTRTETLPAAFVNEVRDNSVIVPLLASLLDPVENSMEPLMSVVVLGVTSRTCPELVRVLDPLMIDTSPPVVSTPFDVTSPPLTKVDPPRLREE